MPPIYALDGTTVREISKIYALNGANVVEVTEAYALNGTNRVQVLLLSLPMGNHFQ